MKKNNNKSESSLRSFTTLAIVIASSLVLASCGGGESTGRTTTDSLSADSPNARAMAVTGATTVPVGWVARPPLNKTVSSSRVINGFPGSIPGGDIVAYKSIKVIAKQLLIYPSNEVELEKFIYAQGWSVLAKSGLAWQVYVGGFDLNEAIGKINKSGYGKGSVNPTMGFNQYADVTDKYSGANTPYGWAIDSIKARAAWSLIPKNSKGVQIGVIDGGFMFGHEDVDFSSISDGKNEYTSGDFSSLCANNDGPTRPVKDTECQYATHGMNVASIISAKGNNNVGLAGIAWMNNVPPMGFSVGGEFGSIMDGINYFLSKSNNSNSPMILNLSMGFVCNPTPCAHAEIYWTSQEVNKFVRQLKNKYPIFPNILIIQSAGNNGNSNFSDISSPIYSDYSGIFASIVGDLISIDSDLLSYVTEMKRHIIIIGSFYGKNSSISSFTSLPHSNATPYIMAPGGLMGEKYADWASDYIVTNVVGAAFSAKNKYIGMAGTSQAAPHVSGVAALVLQANNTLSATEVQDIILSSANNNIGLPYEQNQSGTNNYRYLNAEAAVKEAIARKKCGSVSSPSIVGQLGPNYTATAGQKIQFTTTPAPKTGYPFGSYNWTTSDSSATLVNNGGTLADFVLNTAGKTTVTVTPVLTDGTVCTSSAATAQVNIQAINQPTPSLSIEMSQAGLSLVGATGTGGYTYLSNTASGISKPAVKFTGGYFTVPAINTPDIINEYTYDAWVRVESLAGVGLNGSTVYDGGYVAPIISHYSMLSTDAFGHLYIRPNDFPGFVRSCTTFFNNQIPINSWFKATFTMTRSNNNMSMYVNKNISLSCSDSYFVAGKMSMTIGASFGGGFKFPGSISTINIYNSALSAEQISQLN